MIMRRKSYAIVAMPVTTAALIVFHLGVSQRTIPLRMTVLRKIDKAKMNQILKKRKRKMTYSL
jgi:hypothetical protein